MLGPRFVKILVAALWADFWARMSDGCRLSGRMGAEGGELIYGLG